MPSDESRICNVLKVIAVVTSANDLVIQDWWDLMFRLKIATIPKTSVARVAKDRNRKPNIPEVPPFATKLRATPVGNTVVMMLSAYM